MSTKAVAGNPQRAQLVPGTTSGTETQSGSHTMESTSLGPPGERILNVVREQEVGVEKMGQDLEEECNLEFPMIERQF